MQKPDILGILEYLEPFHNYIPTYSDPCHTYDNLRIFRTLTYFKPGTYAEPSQRFKMKFFAKIVKNYNYVSKALHLRSLTEFWIRNLSISILEWPFSKYSMIHIQNPVYYWKFNIFRHIQVRFRYYQLYCGTFRTLCNSCIFRTLTYSKSWHI